MLVEPALALLALFVQTPASSDSKSWPTAMGYSKISEQSAYVQRMSKLLERSDNASGTVERQPKQSVSSASSSAPGSHTTAVTPLLSPEQLARSKRAKIVRAHPAPSRPY